MAKPPSQDERMEEANSMLDFYCLVKSAADALYEVAETGQKRFTSKDKTLIEEARSCLEVHRLRLEKGAFR